MATGAFPRSSNDPAERVELKRLARAPGANLRGSFFVYVHAGALTQGRRLRALAECPLENATGSVERVRPTGVGQWSADSVEKVGGDAEC